MFHAWQSALHASPEQAEASSSGSAKRRTSTARACEPCRRRKIRCNGEHPCETCQWYRKGASCYYTEPRQKQILSKKSVETISATMQEYREILQKLFPTTPPNRLMELSRESLIDLLIKNSPLQQPPSPVTPGLDEKPRAVNPDAANLEQLQPMPEEDTDGTESRSSDVQGVADDINALSLSVKKSSSYLGISSVMAALRVILWLDPEAQNYFAKMPERGHVASRESLWPPEVPELEHATPRPREGSSSAWDEIPLINAYFNYIHPFVPLIDEDWFRDTYMCQKRMDSRWLLLLNTILALGGMAAASSCEDLGHYVYWNHAKQHLTVETLESVHIETVQALALLGGYYLHYLNKPHAANALMGAALRLATALGLHRDYSEGIGPAETEKAAYKIEMRRRVFWNLFIMDAWHGAALGRPSMGRMSHAISAKAPQQPIGQSQALLAIVQENIRFCMISTKMEDAMAVSPLVPETERRALDNAYSDWFQSSTVQNKTPRGPTGEPAGVTISKNVMRWRYFLWRIIIHRPIFLWYAMRRMPFQQLPEDKKSAIELCRELAAELIDDIATTWRGQKACQMSGWNATWNLYQTLMVPLLSLFTDPSDAAVVEKSCAQVEQGLAALSDLRYWSNIARRSYEVVSRIYEASKRHQTAPEQPSGQGPVKVETPTPTGMRTGYGDTMFASFQANIHGNGPPTTMSQDTLVDNMFDSLNWSTSWNDDVVTPFEMHGLGWGQNSMNGWGAGGGPGAGLSYDQYFPVLVEEDGSTAMNMGLGDPNDGTGMGSAQDGSQNAYQ